MPVLSTEDRGRAIGYLESGRTVRTVAELFHVSTAIISKLYRRYRQTGSVKDRPRSGRPKVTTLVEDRRIRALALRRRFVTAPAIRSQIHEARGQGARHVSTQTIRNRLHTQGIKSRKPAKKPALTLAHREARLRWARNHDRWTRAEWRRVLFTDESRFCLQRNDGRIRVWRRRNERFKDACVKEVRQGHGGGVMVWGGITDEDCTEMIIINGNLNAERYINDVLQPALVPFVERHPNTIFMDDNARPHRSRVVRQFLEEHNIERMDPWPAYSPDMNPIEAIWDQLGKAVNGRIRPGDNLQDLGRYLTEEWRNLPQERVHRVIASMHRRCTALINSYGGPTRYWL